MAVDCFVSAGRLSYFALHLQLQSAVIVRLAVSAIGDYVNEVKEAIVAFLEKFLDCYLLSLLSSVDFLVRHRTTLLICTLRCNRQR